MYVYAPYAWDGLGGQRDHWIPLELEWLWTELIRVLERISGPLKEQMFLTIEPSLFNP